MNKVRFEHWLKVYGDAWENKNADKFVAGFTTDAKYYWTPFEPPRNGKRGIADAFSEAVASQEGINFDYQILNVEEERGLCRWWCSFTRISTQQMINLDGIILAKFNDENICSEFREWWHTDEFNM